MEWVELFDSVLKISVGAIIATTISFFYFRGSAVEKGSSVASLGGWKEEKLDQSLEILIEYNTSVGVLKHAMSNYIDVGSPENEECLKEADKKSLDVFEKFYAIEAYLLSAGATEPHKIMSEYIDLISKLRREFHFTRARESTMSLDNAVLDIRDCRRRLYGSLSECYSNYGVCDA